MENNEMTKREKTILSTMLLTIYVLIVTSCTFISPVPTDMTIRQVRVLIGLDGVGPNIITSNIDRFNKESSIETGIVIIPQYVEFSMEQQNKVWPKCTEPLLCFADWGTIFNANKHDITLYIRGSSIGDMVQRVLIGGVVGETDITRHQHIAIYTTDYTAFKHEVYHVWTGHSWSGVMSPILTPLTSTRLSEASRHDILISKWRKFEYPESWVK